MSKMIESQLSKGSRTLYNRGESLEKIGEFLSVSGDENSRENHNEDWEKKRSREVAVFIVF